MKISRSHYQSWIENHRNGKHMCVQPFDNSPNFKRLLEALYQLQVSHALRNSFTIYSCLRLLGCFSAVDPLILTKTFYRNFMKASAYIYMTVLLSLLSRHEDSTLARTAPYEVKHPQTCHRNFLLT